LVNSIILTGMAWASSLKNAIASRVSEERGQDLIEYAVLVGGIGLVAAIALIGAGASGWLDFGSFKTKIQDCVSFSSGAGTCGG
jgi:hypothetical protein